MFAMTETARHADYMLPAASQFEKCCPSVTGTGIVGTPGRWPGHPIYREMSAWIPSCISSCRPLTERFSGRKK
jgi:hypothetical protein